MSHQLSAGKLHADPRIAEAKKLILQAVEEHQAEINDVRPAADDLQNDYLSTIEKFGENRGGNIFFKYLSSGLGNGPYVELADGSVKLDMITGIGVHGFGHSSKEMLEAGIDAALCDTVMQGNLQQNSPSAELVDRFVELASEGDSEIAHCFLTTSGAMANENALKIAFQNRFPADRVLAFENCFSGRTIALSSLTDRPNYRVGVPQGMKVDYLPFYDYKDPEGSLNRTLEVMQRHVSRYPGKHAILWMELIAGEGGYYPGTHEFFKALCEKAKEHNILVVCDEIQTFARTSRPFAFQHFGLEKWVDLVTIGKISQVCATFFTDALKPKPGLISQTFTGSSWAILAGLKVVNTLIENGHYGESGKNQQLHDEFVRQIQAVGQKYEGSVSGPFGEGGMVAFTAFDGSAEVTKQLVVKLYQAGLMSFMAGGNPSRIRFLMPLGVTEKAHLEKAGQILGQVIGENYDEFKKLASS